MKRLQIEHIEINKVELFTFLPSQKSGDLTCIGLSTSTLESLIPPVAKRDDISTICVALVAHSVLNLLNLTISTFVV